MSPVRNLPLKVLAKREWRTATPYSGAQRFAQQRKHLFGARTAQNRSEQISNGVSTLYVVATSIGNLADITLRALDVLKNVDLILCEDTRQTQKLLNHYEIKTSTTSYHQHSQLKKVEYIIRLLKEGKDLALVSDAGTPGISDPGNKLIEKMTEVEPSSFKIVSIPGVSALTAAASISGFPMDKFVFMGFPPAKKKRKRFFEEVAGSRHPVVFYESPHRILKSLKELSGFNESLEVVVCRELTKKFETVYRGKIGEVIRQINPKGEFVVILKRK